MPSPAVSTFLSILIIVLAMIVWWRAAIAILVAFLVAVLAIGVHEVVDLIDQPAVETGIGPAVGGDHPVPGPSSRTGPR